MLLEALKYDNRIFGLDPQLLFQVAFQMLAIFILFLLASYLLLDPVRKILNDRKERVMKEQKEAKESRVMPERRPCSGRMRLSQMHERRRPVSWIMQRKKQSLKRNVSKMK